MIYFGSLKVILSGSSSAQQWTLMIPFTVKKRANEASDILVVYLGSCMLPLLIQTRVESLADLQLLSHSTQLRTTLVDFKQTLCLHELKLKQLCECASPSALTEPCCGAQAVMGLDLQQASFKAVSTQICLHSVGQFWTIKNKSDCTMMLQLGNQLCFKITQLTRHAKAARNFKYQTSESPGIVRNHLTRYKPIQDFMHSGNALIVE